MFGSVFVQSSFSRLVRVNNDDQTYQITPFIPPLERGSSLSPPFPRGAGGIGTDRPGIEHPPRPPFLRGEFLFAISLFKGEGWLA